MKGEEQMRNVNYPFSALILIMGLTLCAGCGMFQSPIQSEAVRTLVKVEREKILTAKKEASNFTKDTENAVLAWRKSVEVTASAMQDLQTIEAAQALLYAPKEKIAKLTEEKALAGTYQVGTLYLKKKEGLEQTVKDQFEAEFKALKELSKKIQSSWENISTAHGKVVEYSKKTAFAGIDEAFVRQIIVESSGDVEGVETVLKNSKKVNEALKKASEINTLNDVGLSRVRPFSEDLVDLLERISKEPPGETSSP
jgi:hypothetical protein